MVLAFIKNMTIPPHFQCVHMLEDGERCKNTPIKGTNKCWRHNGKKYNTNQRHYYNERNRRNRIARQAGGLFQDEEEEMGRRLRKDLKHFTEDVIDWWLDWFKKEKKGDKKEKLSILKKSLKKFDWKKYINNLEIEEMIKLGKILKIDYPNKTKKELMKRRLVVYLGAEYYPKAINTYNIRNFDNNKRKEFNRILKGINNSANKKKNSPSKKKASNPKS